MFQQRRGGFETARTGRHVERRQVVLAGQMNQGAVGRQQGLDSADIVSLGCLVNLRRLGTA